MSELNERCIESWKKHCPDYEIIKISEENFDYKKFDYSRIAYEQRNWAFVSDIARLEALKEHGGFYLDTDVELFKSLDSVRDNNAIVHETGYGFYASGIMGCEKFPRLYADAYERLEIGKAYYVLLNHRAYEMYNLTGDSYHKEDEVTFYGVEYFGNPRTPITEKTIGVHWDENTWVNSWLGGFVHLADFVPFAIYNPQFNEELTLRLFDQVPTDKSLIVEKETEINIDVLELGNYFYNPKVVRVSKPGVVFKRNSMENASMSNKRLENGCTIWYLD
jgi:hypothetical protein